MRSCKILFINPAKRDAFFVNRVHMGFTLMASTLVDAGHKVRIVDYAFLRSAAKNGAVIPDLSDIMREFNPDVVGISVFTYLYDECCDLIEKLNKLTTAPIVLGGPHFTVFPCDFVDDSRVRMTIRGEADATILEILDLALSNGGRNYICQRPSGSDIPPVNLDFVEGKEFLWDYQIQLSRGCPYSCTFCNIEQMAGRHMRARNIDECLRQIVEAKSRYPNLKSLAITDDCPTYDINRFKIFLRKLIDAKLGMSIWVDNMRANLLDEELLALYKDAGGQNICLGTESGDPDIFKSINKGETMEQIVAAAHLIKKHGLELGLCFVIGLPGDTGKSHARSMQLAKSLKPDYVFWNMCLPWPGTEVYRWFEKNGQMGNQRNFSTLVDPRVNFSAPVASSPDFTQEQRVKAWLKANMTTHKYFTNLHDIGRVWNLALKYRIKRAFIVYFFKTVIPVYCRRIHNSLAWRWPRLRNCIIFRISLIIATLLGLPGVKFGWFGIRASRKCKKAGCDDLAYGLSINPVSCVRYFEFDFARRMLPRNLKGRCLDVSSPRLFSAYMLAQNPDLQMDIINPDTSDLEETGDLLRSLGISSERYGLHNIYADKLPWEDRAFDYIWSISVIEHIPEQQDIITLKEIERVLKFNGLLLLTFPVAGKSQDEFREEDVYGLNKVQKDEERVFFQRWYDDSMQRDRIVSQLEKMEIIAQEIWCERQADWLENYFVNYRKNGLKTASWDPVYMLKYFKRCFAMQGELFAGIKCVCFRKMKSGDMA